MNTLSVSYGMAWFLSCWAALSVLFLLFLALAGAYGIEGRKGIALVLLLAGFACGLALFLMTDYLFFCLAAALHL